MRKYRCLEVSEKQLEDLVRQRPDSVEDGLRYIDHQRATERGPLDILMTDSQNALVVAELKVVEDDGMLVQGIDCYDYVSTNVEGMARMYKDSHVDPMQTVRLFLVAPSFSVSLLNRCKWIDIPLSLFPYKCIALQDSEEMIPVFWEVAIPSAAEVAKPPTLDERLRYITDDATRKMAEDLIEEINGWDPTRITVEATNRVVSLKVSGRVFAWINPRRRHFMVETYDNEGKWTCFPIHEKEQLDTVKVLLKANAEHRG